MEVADAGDRYDGVDVFLLWREAEFDGSRRDDFGDGERTSPLVVQLLHGAVLVIIPLHVICCPFECNLHLLLGMIQLPHEGVHSLHCQCPHRLYSQVWVLTIVELKGVQCVATWILLLYANSARGASQPSHPVDDLQRHGGMPLSLGSHAPSGHQSVGGRWRGLA